MNEAKWIDVAATREATDDRLFAKLVEEVGEVANAHIEKTTKDLGMELEHIIFIARCWLWRLDGCPILGKPSLNAND